MTGRLGAGRRAIAPAAPGMRVVVDVRPLQEPARAPTTATYLGELLGAYADDPLVGESFAIILQAGLPDPIEAAELAGLPVVARRALPPSSLLGSGSLTVDPFLLRSASVGTSWGAERDGAAGSVYHAAGGAVPLASGVPVVVTLLDLAPWELPAVYQASIAARFGQRLRARILRDAAAVIVGSTATANAVRRLLRVRRERIRVVRLAARPVFRSRGGRRRGRRGGTPRHHGPLFRLPGPLRRPAGPGHAPARLRHARGRHRRDARTGSGGAWSAVAGPRSGGRRGRRCVAATPHPGRREPGGPRGTRPCGRPGGRRGAAGLRAIRLRRTAGRARSGGAGRRPAHAQ